MLVEFRQVSTPEEEKAVISAKQKTTDIQNAIELLEGTAGGIDLDVVTRSAAH